MCIRDSPYYNYHRHVAYAPSEVRNWYKHELPRTSARELNEDSVLVYNELMRLHSAEIRWPGKHTLSISEALKFMGSRTTKQLESLLDMNNEVHSLGPRGFLVDGVHPSKDLANAFWEMLYEYHILDYGRRPRSALFPSKEEIGPTINTLNKETPEFSNSVPARSILC